MNEQQAIDKFYAMAEKLESPKPSKSVQAIYWEGMADKLTLDTGKPMVVVHDGEYWQVWNKSIADKNANVVYETGGSE